MRKTKPTDKSIIDDSLERELKEINSALNRFLKLYFTIEIQSLQQYLHQVKDLLIQLTTKSAPPLITNVFSKFSNILQPFTSYSYDLNFDGLKQETATLRQENSKLKRKNQRLKTELEEYRLKSSKSMEFIYMLRINNINVDELFRKGMKQKPNLAQQEEDEVVGRVGVELNGQELLEGISQQSNLTSQYVSIKSKR